MSLMFTGLPRHPPFAELSDELRDFSRCTGLPRYLADARHPSCPSPDSNREPFRALRSERSASASSARRVGGSHTPRDVSAPPSRLSRCWAGFPSP